MIGGTIAVEWRVVPSPGLAKIVNVRAVGPLATIGMGSHRAQKGLGPER